MGCGISREIGRRGPFGPVPAVALAVLVGALAAPPPSGAIAGRSPDADPWVGSQVVLKSLGTHLHNGAQDVDIHFRYQRYRVEKATRDEVLIVCNGVSGWVSKDKVVLFHRAADYFTGVLKHSPSPELYNMRGLIWRDRKQPQKAIDDFTRAIELSPASAWLYSNRGIVLSEQRRFDEAIADYTQAIRLSPTYPSAYNNRGLVWAAKQEYDKAIADYTQAIRLDPGHPLPYTNRANVYRHKKDFDRALDDYSEAIRLNPRNPLSFTNRGLAWSGKKEYARALADLKEAVRIDPKHATAVNDLAWFRATCPVARYRDGYQAVELATRACELTNWGLAMMIDTLAAAHAEAGEFGDAMTWQAKAIDLLPKDSPMLDSYRARLALYESLKPYRDEEEE